MFSSVRPLYCRYETHNVHESKKCSAFPTLWKAILLFNMRQSASRKFGFEQGSVATRQYSNTQKIHILSMLYIGRYESNVNKSKTREEFVINTLILHQILLAVTVLCMKRLWNND